MGKQQTVAGGMFLSGTRTRVPLTGVQIDVFGSGAAAQVRVRQKYVNTESCPVEAVYSFPLEEGSAVYELAIETGGRILRGKIEEREAAFEQYDEAMAAGNGAFLADQDRPNIFTLSVGNLLPGQEATVSLRYASELEQHADTVRILLPTTIAPRYVPQPLFEGTDPAELERINPPKALGPVPYGLSLKLEYRAAHGVKSVACASHPAQVSVEGGRVLVELLGSNIQLDRDFVLDIVLAKPFAPCALISRDGDDAHAVMVNLYPEIRQDARMPGEFIFLLDRSGSMAGGSMEQALNALRLALRSLEEGDRFNIIGFGSSHESMFPSSRAYDQAALEEATRILGRWDADLGGTELYAPLMAILDAPPGKQPRQLMLLTDGQVANEAQCIAAAAKKSGSIRIFTFGIGHGASEFLLKGLARACGGKAEFIHPNERIEPVVMRQFRRAAAPYLQNLRIDWGSLQTELVAPRQLPTLFDGDRLTMYARLGKTTTRGAVEVAVLADSAQGSLRFPVTLDFARIDNTTMVPVLMARAAIRELEEGRDDAQNPGSNQRARKKDTISARVLELALRYGILSSQTSFVAVEERAEDTQTERAQLRRVPVALTHGWGDDSRDAVDVLYCKSPSYSAGSSSYLDLPAFLRARPAADSAAPSALSSADIGDPSEPRLARADRSDSPPSRASRWDVFHSLSRSSPMRALDRKSDAAKPDPFLLLTLSQQADGSFRLDKAAIEAFGLNKKILKSASKSLGADAAAELVLHTALTLALLHKRFPEREDEWQMLGAKAQRWLDKQAIPFPDGATSWAAWAALQCGVG